MRTKNDALTLDGTDMTANIASDAIWLGHIVNYAVQVVYSGAGINGTLKLQASNDEGSNDLKLKSPTITNWTDVSTQAVTAAGSTMFNVQDCGYRWVRLVWIDSSSTAGTISSARINVKGL